MKEKLIELLGLATDASDAQILQAVRTLKGNNEELTAEKTQRGQNDAREKAIQKKIAESGGALSREMAIMALDHQAEENAKRKGKK